MGSARCCEEPRFFVPFTRVLRVRADGTFVIHRHVIEHDHTSSGWPLRPPSGHGRHHRLFDVNRSMTYDGPLAA